MLIIKVRDKVIIIRVVLEKSWYLIVVYFNMLNVFIFVNKILDIIKLFFFNLVVIVEVFFIVVVIVLVNSFVFYFFFK